LPRSRRASKLFGGRQRRAFLNTGKEIFLLGGCETFKVAHKELFAKELFLDVLREDPPSTSVLR